MTFLHLGSPVSPLALHLSAVLNTEINNKKDRNVKVVALNRLRKGCLFGV